MGQRWATSTCHSWQRRQERRHITRLGPPLCVVCPVADKNGTPLPSSLATLCCVEHALVQCCDVHYAIHRRIAHQPKRPGGQILPLLLWLLVSLLTPPLAMALPVDIRQHGAKPGAYDATTVRE